MAEMTLKELAAWHGFSEKHLRNLCKKGMPHQKDRKKKGRPAYQFENQAVIKWLAAKGIVSKGMEKLAGEGAPEPKTELPPKEEQKGTSQNVDAVEPDLVQQAGILGAYERLKLQEFMTAKLILQEKRKKDPNPSTILTLQKQYSDEIEQLRKMAMAVLAYKKKAGRLCDLTEIEYRWRRIAQTVRNAVMSIAPRVAPQLRHLLSKPDHIYEAQSVLEAACRAALAGLSETDAASARAQSPRPKKLERKKREKQPSKKKTTKQKKKPSKKKTTAKKKKEKGGEK